MTCALRVLFPEGMNVVGGDVSESLPRWILWQLEFSQDHLLLDQGHQVLRALQTLQGDRQGPACLFFSFHCLPIWLHVTLLQAHKTPGCSQGQSWQKG